MRDILAAVTPGGGKSLLPVIAAARLIVAGTIERVVWVVPRDSLRLQAQEAFADPGWRETLGYRLSVRAADNEPDPSRGLAGYVTTYQGIAAAPDLHLAEMRRYRTLLVVDEVHHLPGLADYEPGTEADAANSDEASSWSRALLPMLECASYRLLLSGTLERADRRAVLWLPYPGTSRQVHRFVAERRTKPTRSGRKPRGETTLVPETPAVEAPFERGQCLVHQSPDRTQRMVRPDPLLQFHKGEQ